MFVRVEAKVVTRVVTKMRRVVRRLGYGKEQPGASGTEIAASWRSMMARLDRRALETETRLREAERALNRRDSH